MWGTKTYTCRQLLLLVPEAPVPQHVRGAASFNSFPILAPGKLHSFFKVLIKHHLSFRGFPDPFSGRTDYSPSTQYFTLQVALPRASYCLLHDFCEIRVTEPFAQVSEESKIMQL